MKQRKIITSVGYVLASAALCSMSFMPMYAAAENGDGDSGAAVESSQQSDGINSVSTEANGNTATQKSETVYVFTQADGTVKNIEVSDALKNSKQLDKIADSSELSNIENVEGHEDFSGSGDSMQWNAGGNDIYYKGTIDKALPVSMKITYTLDGKEISASDLAGKSGKVSIHYEFTNNSSVTGGYVPFVCAGGLMLDNDHFKNVSVTNGKVLDDGDRTTVAGLAIPGLQSYLGVGGDVVDIPSGFTITAETDNFDVDSSLTLVDSSIFADMDTSDLSMSGLEDSLGELDSAMDELISGSGSLHEGLEELANGADTLHISLMAMKDGTSTTTGLQDAVDAIGADDSTSQTTLIGGINTIQSQLPQIDSTTNEGVNNSVQLMQNGLGQAKNGVETAGNTLDTYVVSNLNSATDTSNGSLAALQHDLGVLASDTSGLSTEQQQALADASTQLSTLGTQVRTAKGYAQGVSDSLHKTDNPSIQYGIQSVSDGLNNFNDLANQMQALSTGLSQIKGGLQTVRSGGVMADGRISVGLEGAIAALGDDSNANTLIGGSAALASGAQTAADGSETLTNGLNTFDEEGIQKLIEALGGLSALGDKVTSLSSAAQSYNNFSGIAPGTEGKVKFIYEADAISAETNDSDENSSNED
ncbi:MAG: hypothetical protein ACOYCA_03310 [Eggerthellaceae bacterium]|jgi:putative membrane protein